MYRGNGVLNPFADQRMPVLTHWKVVRAGQEEGLWRVEAPLIKDGMDCHNEEV